MLADVGTGDGRFVLATAVANPTLLVIGIDPVADALAEASRRAAAPPRKGGLPNALFIHDERNTDKAFTALAEAGTR